MNSSTYNAPNESGYYGNFGGQFIPETLISTIQELKTVFNQAKEDPDFQKQISYYAEKYVGRKTPLFFAQNLTTYLQGPKIYLKREDLNHTGAHKINNAIGQALLAKRMGKNKIIAETGAGQHGVATATAAALLQMECKVFMGAEDIRRQALNVYRMRLLGAEVVSVNQGGDTLKAAINETLRYWVANANDTHYVIGSVMGPHPFPEIVRYFQSVIGQETKEQLQQIEGRLPDAILACLGGGSNAIGMFYPFINHPEVELIGVEAYGKGRDSEETAATIYRNQIGYLHGAKMNVLQDEHGQIQEAYSISAGLDYPGIGPEHSHLNEVKRVQYVGADDQEALNAFQLLSKTEGIIPALESSHAVAHALKKAKEMNQDEIIVINISGRGDKDVAEVKNILEGE